MLQDRRGPVRAHGAGATVITNPLAVVQNDVGLVPRVGRVEKPVERQVRADAEGELAEAESEAIPLSQYSGLTPINDPNQWTAPPSAPHPAPSGTIRLDTIRLMLQ